MNKFLTINGTNIKSAVVSTLITGVLAMAMYIINVGDIFKIVTKDIANIGAMAILTGVVSLLKSLLTTSDGNFLGAVKVTNPEQ